MPQKYGRKPNTRRARGMPRRDKGHRHRHSPEWKAKRKIYLEEKKAERKRLRELERAERKAIHSGLPRSQSVLKNYIFMYNWFHRAYEWYRDADVAYTSTEEKFKVCRATVKKALDVVTYLKEFKNMQTAPTNGGTII